jgi:hypothetical protein
MPEKPEKHEQEAGDELRPYEPVTDDVVLAAVERAERHRNDDREGVIWEEVVGHLGFVRGSWTTRQLRPQVETLVEVGLLVRSRRQGLAVWSLTDAGRERSGTHAAAVALPESPQHRAWRHTRASAGELIEGFRAQARQGSEEAAALLDSRQRVRSDAWLLLADRLDRAFRRLGLASYCLYEWPEPDDTSADVDTYQDPGDEQLDEDTLFRLRGLRRYRRSFNWKEPFEKKEKAGEQPHPDSVITVPPGMLGELRNGLHAVLGSAAVSIAQTTARRERERHPEWYTEQRAQLERTCALLDLIGWGEPRHPAAMRIDLHAHQPALTEALEVRLLVAADDLEEAGDVDAERAERGEPPTREITEQRVAALHEFAAAIRGVLGDG